MSCQKDTCQKCFRTKQSIPCVFCDEVGCEVKYTTDCVVYTGDDLLCYGVSPGFSLTQVLLTLLALVFPNCNTTSTTTI